MKIDAHNFDLRLKNTVKKIENSAISAANKKIILKFKDNCITNGLGSARIEKYIQTLYSLALMLKKDFEKAKKQDIIKLVSLIEKNNKWSDWTKHDYKLTIRKFFTWLRNSETPPEEVSWIKLKVKNGNHKLPEELLTEEEVKRLIESAKDLRNKALIACLYESGCRIGEILALKLKNIQFKDLGAQIIVEGKTGMRRVLLISSVPYLSAWVNEHPDKNNPNAPLWVNKVNHEFLNYSACASMLRDIAKKAEIKKRVNPHSFRHSRATHLANHLTEAQMKQYFGWVQGSDMASVYVHLSGRDVDKAIMKVYGLEKESEKKEESILKPKKCPRCDKLNPATAKLCNNCGLALDVRTALEIEERNKKFESIRKKIDSFIDEAIKRNPEIQKMMLMATQENE
ncbi:MAG: site-specific integrase [Nanoarchaeota archaeon]